MMQIPMCVLYHIIRSLIILDLVIFGQQLMTHTMWLYLHQKKQVGITPIANNVLRQLIHDRVLFVNGPGWLLVVVG